MLTAAPVQSKTFRPKVVARRGHICHTAANNRLIAEIARRLFSNFKMGSAKLGTGENFPSP